MVKTVYDSCDLSYRQSSLAKFLGQGYNMRAGRKNANFWDTFENCLEYPGRDQPYGPLVQRFYKV